MDGVITANPFAFPDAILSYDPDGPTDMELAWADSYTDFNTVITGSQQFQPAVNQMHCGSKTMITSSYEPGAPNWIVSRIDYKGIRKAHGEEWADHPVVFTSAVDTVGNGDNGDPESPVDYCEGDFVIMLPACREYLDTAFDTPEDPDRNWVAAIRKTSLGPTQVVAAKWFSEVWRGGLEDYDEGFADGTLHLDEVAAGEMIVDAEDPPAYYSEFGGETWEGFRLVCYNRVWDSVERKCVNFMLFTTQGTPEIAEEAFSV